MAYNKPYVNPIGAFIGGAFRAIIGPIMAPFMLIAIGIGSWAHTHYGVDEIMTVNYAMGAILLLPIVCYLVYKLWQLVWWITATMYENGMKANAMLKARSTQTKPVAREPQHAHGKFFPRFENGRMTIVRRD